MLAINDTCSLPFADFNCPPGEFIINFSGITGNTFGVFALQNIQGALSMLNATCNGGRTFTAGAKLPFPIIYPDCPYGYTGVDIYYSGFYGVILVIAPVCNGFHMQIGYTTNFVNDAFSCPPGQRLVGVTGYSSLTFIHSLSFTCGDGYPSLPPITPSRALESGESYDLVEPNPDCYYKLGPEYCPKPFDGFRFDDVYMVSRVLLKAL